MHDIRFSEDEVATLLIACLTADNFYLTDERRKKVEAMRDRLCNYGNPHKALSEAEQGFLKGRKPQATLPEYLVAGIPASV